MIPTATTRSTHQFTGALRRGAVRATLAASVHNTQPWRFLLAPNQLDIMADPRRQLQIVDATGRQLVISCGCALFNARVAIAATGLDVQVERGPDPSNMELLARIRGRDWEPKQPIADLDTVIESRHTNRRQFDDDEVSVEIAESLQDAARAEGSELLVVSGDDQRQAVSRLSRKAQDIQALDPAYRAELRAWTSTDVAAADEPDVRPWPTASSSARQEFPARRFDIDGTVLLPHRTHFSDGPALFVLTTTSDTPMSWLQAGESLQRILLEVTRQGLTATPMNQVTEVDSTRQALGQQLEMQGFPQVLLRIGRAPATPATHRRRLVEVLLETV